MAETLEYPDEVIPGDGREQIAVRNYGNREVRVVFEEIEAGVLLIYTVMRPKVTPLE